MEKKSAKETEQPDSKQNAGPDKPESSTVVSKISSLIGLYAVFVFVSGWTYLDFYYRTFGVYTRWLDIPLAETLTKGFVILFEGGRLLWVIYVFVLVVPVLFEVIPKLRSRIFAQIVAACLMLTCLPATYLISRSVGSKSGLVNQGASTALADIRFGTDCGLYLGKLLFVKDGAYYIHDARLIKEYKSSSDCWKPSDTTDTIHALTIFRTDNVRYLEISEGR